MHSFDLPADYALVLQQVGESGQEDFTGLAESLQLDRSRLTHVIQALQHKHLIRISRTAQDSLIRLSARGRRLVTDMWPEMRTGFSY